LEKYHPGIALATLLSLMIWRNIIKISHNIICQGNIALDHEGLGVGRAIPE
jgi:hypothetical protein